MRRAVLLLLVACRGANDGPPCGTVAAKFLDIARRDVAAAKADETTTRGLTDQLPAMRDSLAQVCTDGKWSQVVRKCLVDADDHVAFAACEQQLTDEQRRNLERATRGESESP